MSDTRTWIDWTPAKRDRFRVAYNEAVTNQREVFVFDGHTFLTTYAGYLLEYLGTIFKEEKYNGHQGHQTKNGKAT